MPLFGRSLKNKSEDELSGGEAAGSDSVSRRTIGELLRETRLAYGGQVDKIAASLRIRAAYLTAIEESKYDRLPAQVYAMGFVRAYANFLGLDADEAVRRFKQETSAFEAPRGLSFPVPLGERSIPGGTMLLAALIFAFCGYGLWYYVSTGERARPERVSLVPSELKPPAPPQPPANAATPPATTSPVSSDAGGAAALPPAPPKSDAVAAAPAETAPPAPSAPASSSSTTAPPATSETAPAPPAPPESPARLAPPAAATAPAVSPPVAALLSPTAPPAPPPSLDQSRIFGAVGAPARIVISAHKDSWVQIREDNRILVDRILHPGDSYRVPDRPGLVLRTGNGSGLDIAVDGAMAPAVGGTVRRNIALDPARLMAGTAITD